MRLTEESLSREKSGLIKPYVLPENYFPRAESLLRAFNRMKFLELEQFKIKLKYHEIRLTTTHLRRYIEIYPKCSQYGHSVGDDNRVVDVEYAMNYLYGSARVVRTTGFKAPNYLRELKELDKKNDYSVDWNEYLLYSADYIDLRGFSVYEIKRCFCFDRKYENAHKVFVTPEVLEKLRSGKVNKG